MGPLLFGDRLLPTKQPVQIVSGGCNCYTTQQLLFFQQWKNKSGNCRFFLVARRLLFCFYSCVTIVCHFKCCALISPLVKAEPNIFVKMCEIRKEAHIIKRQPSVTDKDRGTLLTISNKNHILLKKTNKLLYAL